MTTLEAAGGDAEVARAAAQEALLNMRRRTVVGEVDAQSRKRQRQDQRSSTEMGEEDAGEEEDGGEEDGGDGASDDDVEESGEEEYDGEEDDRRTAKKKTVAKRRAAVKRRSAQMRMAMCPMIVRTKCLVRVNEGSTCVDLSRQMRVVLKIRVVRVCMCIP